MRGQDGVIKQWTLSFEHVRSFTLSEADVPPLLPRLRSLDGLLAPAGGQINCILAATASGASDGDSVEEFKERNVCMNVCLSVCL